MSARILSGKESAAVLRGEVAGRVGALASAGKRVGEDPASQVYVRNKHRAAEAAGMRSFDHVLPEDASQSDVEAFVDELNGNPEIDGYIVQLPMPDHLDEQAVLARIDPAKDADGLHVANLGRTMVGLPGPRPATPAGILRMLDHFEIETSGRHAVVMGRSTLVGRPLSVMLSAKDRNATVTVVHTGTADLEAITRQADLLFVAVGRPGTVGASHVKPGAAVIDVGTTRTDSGLTGDVVFDEVVEVAGAISPVPGGVGPMTIAWLLANTVVLAEGRPA